MQASTASSVGTDMHEERNATNEACHMPRDGYQGEPNYIDAIHLELAGSHLNPTFPFRLVDVDALAVTATAWLLPPPRQRIEAPWRACSCASAIAAVSYTAGPRFQALNLDFLAR